VSSSRVSTAKCGKFHKPLVEPEAQASGSLKSNLWARNPRSSSYSTPDRSFP